MRGRARLPGSKSVTQRALALAAIAGRRVRIENPLRSDDIRHFARGLEVLGLRVEEPEGGALVVEPGPPTSAGELWCGAGGTMMRLMTGVLAARPGVWRLDGTARLRERPLGPLLAALRGLGADLECPGEEGHPPIVIRGGLAGGSTTLDASESSQYLSAVLLAGLSAERAVEVRVTGLTSRPYVDLTTDAIRAFGGVVESEGNRWTVRPGLSTPPPVFRVEGDWSAAAYPAAAAVLTGGSILLEGVDATSAQGDRGFLAVLERMGARVEVEAEGVRVRGTGDLQSVDTSLAELPDQVPTLAALAPFARGTTRITEVGHLRIKESDRLRAMTTELRRLGAIVDEREDGLVIEGSWAESDPGPIPRDVVLETWDDHRIAMSLALVGLRRPGLRLADPGVVSKSWPSYFSELEEWTSAPRGGSAES